MSNGLFSLFTCPARLKYRSSAESERPGVRKIPQALDRNLKFLYVRQGSYRLSRWQRDFLFIFGVNKHGFPLVGTCGDRVRNSD